MASCTFHPACLHGEAAVPPAKSEAHRAILLAALGGAGPCRLHGFTPPWCDDIAAMMAGVCALGAKVLQEGDVLLVAPAPPVDAKADAKQVEFHVHACAAALRMLIPAFWVRGQAVRITMEDALFARPLDPLVQLAQQAGVGLRLQARQGENPAFVEVSGQLYAGVYEVDGSLSSQFASGLLMALPHAVDTGGKPAPSTLIITPPIASRPYVDMTLRQMDKFGVEYGESLEGQFALPAASRKNPPDVKVHGDWSQGAVLLCANAMGSGVVVENLRYGQSDGALHGIPGAVSRRDAQGHVAEAKDAGIDEAAGKESRIGSELLKERDERPEAYEAQPKGLALSKERDEVSKKRDEIPPLQGDARIAGLLRQMGMQVRENAEGLCAASPSRAPLWPLVADCEDIPDLAPILALTCTQAQGVSILTGVNRLRVKECDRLEATRDILTTLGAEVTIADEDNTLTVKGPVRLRGGLTLDSWGDHRMVMLLAMAALIADGPITVTGVECISKSWPGFLETYQQLGGEIS